MNDFISRVAAFAHAHSITSNVAQAENQVALDMLVRGANGMTELRLLHNNGSAFIRAYKLEGHAIWHSKAMPIQDARGIFSEMVSAVYPPLLISRIKGGLECGMALLTYRYATVKGMDIPFDTNRFLPRATA